MRRMHVLIVLGVLVSFAAQGAGAAGLIKHISGGGTDVANGTKFKDALTAVVAGYPTTDTLMIDDSAIYDLDASSGALVGLAQPIRIVAAPNTTPTITYGPANATGWFITTAVPGTQFGSSAAGENGRITFDGKNQIARFIGLGVAPVWATTAFATTTIENVVIQGMNDGRNTSNRKYYWGITCGGWDTAKPMNAANIINIRNVEFKLPPAQNYPAGNKIGPLTLGPENGSTFNVENVRSNGSRGYIMDIGSGAANYAAAYGTVNIKNCSFYQDQFSTSPLVQAPIQTGGWDKNNGGYDINIDNCFIRTDAQHSSQIASWARTSNTSDSLGCITLNACSKNNLTITNSALVGTGAVIAVQTSSSLIRVTNSDLYVANPSSVSDGTPSGFVTPGYFINLNQGYLVSGHSNHQTTMTRCNLFGANGSNLVNPYKPASDRFVMVSCNDWSWLNAYSAGWITIDCVNGGNTGVPGENPGYGAPAGGDNSAAAIAARDFTVYNKTISALNIGSNRAFNMGVPVEMSSFQLN